MTCLAIDSTRNFLLSGSKDHNVHIWKLANLLSFSNESRIPYKTFSDHRGVITSLSASHSQISDSFAISASEDKTVLIWNFRTASRLATILVTSIPRCLALDPADRAFYIGFEDSIQFVDLNSVSFKSPNEAIELGEEGRWVKESPLLCLAVNSDSTHLLTGHQNGKVFKRTTPKGQPTLVYDSHLPVSNIVALDPIGFPNQRQPATTPSIVKPRLDMMVKDGSLLPDRYEFHAAFTSLPLLGNGTEELLSEFDELLEHPSFPNDLLSAPLTSGVKFKDPELDEATMEELTKLKQDNQLASTKLEFLESEIKRLQQVEVARRNSKKLNRIRRSKAIEAMRKKTMGEKNGVHAEEVDQEMGDVSSDTDG